MNKVDWFPLAMFLWAIFSTVFFIIWFGLTRTSTFMILVSGFASLFFVVAIVLTVSKRKITDLSRAGLVTNAIILAVSSSPMLAIVLLSQIGGIAFPVSLAGTLTGAIVGVWLAVLARGVYLRLKG